MKVSVLMIAYNQENYIARAIEGIVSQKCNFEFELIIGDDCSSDKTQEIIKEYTAKYPHIIKPILREKNLGMNQNFWDIYKRANADYIAMCEGDDYWIDENKLQLQVDFMDANKDFTLCFHNANVVYQDENNPNKIAKVHPFISRNPIYENNIPMPKEITELEDIVLGNYIQTCTAMYRNKVVTELPDWFFEQGVGDWLLHIFHAEKGKIKYIDKIMASYRIHQNGVWALKPTKFKIEKTVDILQNINSYFNDSFKQQISKKIKELYYSLAGESISFALKAYKEKKYEDTLVHLETALDSLVTTGSGKLGLYELKAKCEMELGRIEEAFESITNEMILFPENENAYNLQEELANSMAAGLNTYSNYKDIAEQSVADGTKKYDISIIIPVFNMSNLTYQCLDSLYKSTSNKYSWEVIVVDNGSYDETPVVLYQYASQKDNFRFIRNENNQGFAKACNIGMVERRGQHVLLLNNDTYLLENWLEALVDEMLSDENIGICGSCLIYPDSEKVQHIGIKIGTEDGVTLAPYHNKRLAKHSETPEAHLSRDVSAVTGASFLIRNTVIDKIGLLDDIYMNGCEDIDYCLLASANGFRIRYVAKSIFYHFESMSESRHDWDIPNWQRLNKKWLGKVKFDESQAETNAEVNAIKQREDNISAELEDMYAEITEDIHQSNIEHNEKIDFSIIIPVHNNVDFTRECINSVQKTSALFKIEVIVIDNASSDETKNYLNSISDKIKLITNTENISYAKANNQGSKIAKGNFLIFLNNDTQVLPGWLESLEETFESKPNVAIQGAKLLYPNDTIQHAGIVYGQLRPDLSLHYHIYLTAKPDEAQVCEAREYQMITGALLAIRTNIFNEIAGFDENYFFGHEDLDLCLAVRQKGMSVWYNPNVVAYHFESVTKKSEGIEKFERFISNPNSYDAKNHKYFLSKWQSIIKEDADDFYKLDGFYGLVSDKTIREQFEKRALEVYKKAKALYENKQIDALKTFSEIIYGTENFEFLQKPGILVRLSDKTMRRAEEFFEIESFNHNEEEVTQDVKEEGSSKRKILFTMYGWNESGGGTTFPKSVAKALANMGNEVVVFYAAGKHSQNKNPYYQEIRIEDGVKLYGIFNRPTVFLDSNNPEREVKDAEIVKLFDALLLEYKPDLVHFHNFLGLSFALAETAKIRNIATFYTPHNYHLIDPKLYMIENLQKWESVDFLKNSELPKNYPYLIDDYKFRKEKALEMIDLNLDLIFAVSSRQKELLVEWGANSKKITVVNQIPASTVELSKHSILHSEIHKPLRFGYIGGLMPHKGVHNIILASKLLDENDAEFHFYGFVSEEYLRFLQSIKTKTKLVFHGEYAKEDLPKIAESLDAIILPSIWEDCAPLTIAESLSMGLPVIAARIGGFTDFIKNGYNGSFFEYDSHESLAAAINSLATNPSIIKELSENAKLRLSFDDYIMHILEVYDLVLSGNEYNEENTSLLFLRDGISQKIEINTESISNKLFIVEEVKNYENPDAMNRLQFGSDLNGGFSNQRATAQLPEQLPSPLRLNLGCGKDVREGFLNLDLFSSDSRVIGLDIRKLPFADATVDYILASDVLEHFSHREVDIILKEWARVLKSGGILEIRCPNLRLQLQAYMRGDWDADIASYMIFGGQTNPGDYHCIGFDERSIRNHLGLVGLEVIDYREHDFPQDQGYINLNMTVVSQKLTLSPSVSDTSEESYSMKVPENNDLFTGMNFLQTSHSKPDNKENVFLTPKPFAYSENYKPKLNIVWEGSQFVFHSLALINREHVFNLLTSEQANVTVIPFENDKFLPEGNEKYEKIYANDIRVKHEVSDEISKLPYIWIRHQWPPKAEAPKGAKWIVMQPWEFSALRKDFVEIFNSADEVWTPSNFCREVFVNSGVDFDKVQVIPNGIDPLLFSPIGKKYNLKTKKSLKFLYVGGTIMRKGIDILLSAYSSAFNGFSDVCLVIKDMGGDSFYKGQTAKNIIEQIQNNPNSPEIEYIDEMLSEEDIASLYRACDVFVSPYRGEGFSLPTLEAMACGLPVIVTKGGATDDFVDEQIGWQIPADKVSIGTTIDGYELSSEAYLFEPKEDALIAIMKEIDSNPSILLQLGIVASHRARTNWTWQKATQKLMNRIDRIYDTDMAVSSNESFPEFIDEAIELGIAEQLYAERKFVEAEQIYLKLVDCSKFSRRIKLYIHFCLVMIYIETDEFESADELILKAEDIVPNSIDANFLQAKIKALMGELTVALELLTPVMDKWQSQKHNSTLGLTLDSILCFTGDILFALSDFGSSQQVYETALQVNSENLNALYGAGIASIELGEIDKAKQSFSQLLNLNPSDSEVRQMLAGLDE